MADGILQVGEQKPESQPELKPGMIKIKDINGFDSDVNGNPVVDANGRFIRTGKPDGIIDDADTKLLGTSDASLMAGITNIFTYKNFSLNFDFNALFGRRFADPNYTAYGVSAAGVYSNGYNALRVVKERWTPENPSATHPSSFYGWSPYGVGDFFMQEMMQGLEAPDEAQLLEADKATAPEGCSVKSVARTEDGGAVADYECA